MREAAEVAVVGAGVAGLAAAWRLARTGARVTVLEASDAVGGVIRTRRADGFLLETGANSMADPPPAARALLREAGLEARLVPTQPAAKRRYVVRGGRPVALPASPPELLTTELFSMGARLRILGEPFVPPAPADRDESVAELIRRRLGPELLAYAVEPFVAGIYAGDPERLSAAQALPKLKALETRHGSFIQGAFGGARERRAAGRTGGAAGPRSWSFPDGMGELPATLAAGLGAPPHLGARVRRPRATGDGWSVAWETGAGTEEEARFDAVVLAVPAHALADLLPADADPAAVEALAGIEHAPVAVVHLGYRRRDVAHPLDGFGMLVPAVERRGILGCLFSSTLYAGRAPEGHALLTVFVGGMREPAAAGLPEDALLARVDADLRALLGVRGAPVLRSVTAWARAIPQYTLGYGARKARMDALEAAHPGLVLCGSYRAGVSVGDTLASGLAAAERALAAAAAPVGA